MTRIPFALRAGTALFAMTAATAAAAQSIEPPADVAQNQASPSDETTRGGDIVVTGSRIRRDPLSQDAPVTFIDQTDILKTGLSNVNDVLQRLPSSGGGLNAGNNTSGNIGSPPDGSGVGAGSAEIDLRYLGSRRVLVLVDGLRYVNGASASGVPGSTDLNSIPASAIDRVEVLLDSASAIYGSDAIAGVVNIITKQRQAGFDASAQLGSYLDEGDGFTQNYQLSWGNGTEGPLQVVVGGNYVKSKGVSAGDRDISKNPEPYGTTCDTPTGGCSRFSEFGRFDGAIFGGSKTLNVPTLGKPTFPNDFRDFDNAARFNFAPFNFLEVPVERMGVFGNLKYELSDSINFSAKAIYNKRKSKNEAAPLPLGIGPDVGNGNLLDTITVSASNPFNPFGVDLVAGGNYDAIYRRVTEIGTRQYSQTVDTYYGVATLDGSFALGAGDWFWDVNGIYGKNKAKQTFTGNINAAKLQQALGPVAACTAPCVPFNMFGSVGAITQDMLDFISFIEHDSSEQETWDFTANISGKLFHLPGGDLGLAAGVEYRDLSGRYDPDPVIAAGLGADIPSQPTKGSYNVKEAYLELNAPVLSGVTMAELLEFNGAVRVFDYSTSGSDSTLEAGVNWMPAKGLRFRANWSQGFRAPSIGELFGSLSRFDSAIDDPCSINSGQDNNITNDPAVLANCTAQGGVGADALPTDQTSVITGGNEDLQPETSKSWTLGGVFSPTFLPGFSAEVNWYKISIDGAIQSIPAQTTVNSCVYQNDALACGNVRRSTSGAITQIIGTLQNIAGIRTTGTDVNLAYHTAKTDWGRFGFTWNNTFLHKFDVITPTDTGTQTQKRRGHETGSPAQAYPKFKALGAIDWDYDEFGATLSGQYIGGVTEIGAGAPNHLGSIFYTDAQLRWNPTFMSLKNIGLAVGVNNIFDAHTPGCVGCDINNFDPTTYRTPGRYYYARIGVKY
jgi:iron complex outermembrane receptor protein